MDNYYEALGLTEHASARDIKSAFRERAKRLHPDVAGSQAGAEMRRLLAAYQVLSSEEKRAEYDRAYHHFFGKGGGLDRFDYRVFLRERRDDPASQAILVFFDLLHLQETAALDLWRELGGLAFPLRRYLDREDWMDCAFLLAEELDKRGAVYESLMLLAALVREERRRPYFRHFMEEVEGLLRAIARERLERRVDDETFVACMEALLELGFPAKEEARWLRAMTGALLRLGDHEAAQEALSEALRRDPRLSGVTRLRKLLGFSVRENKTS